MAAVQHTLLISSEAAPGKKVDIKKQYMVCPHCKKEEHIRDGWYHGKHEKRQRYKCTACKRRFSGQLGFEYRQVLHLYITLALMLYGIGITVANIQMTLKHLRVEVYMDTRTRNLEHYSHGVYTKTIKLPYTGDKWGCDEKYQKVCGKESCVVAVMYITTRRVLAWDILYTKKKYDAAPLLRAARDTACKIPRLFITDGIHQYHIAFKKVFRTLKGIRSIHIRDIHIRNLICKQERLNGGFADRFRYIRGINKEESLIFRIVIIHYNYIKPHGSIASRTPAEAAGIDMYGTDKWLTLIQNAVSAA